MHCCLQEWRHKSIKCIPETNSLIDGDLGRNLRPETSIFDRSNLLLRVSVHMHVKHQAAERGTQIIGQVLIGHTAQDQIHIQLAGDLVYGQVLTVQTHPGKEVQLTPKRKYYASLELLELCLFNQN